MLAGLCFFLCAGQAGATTYTVGTTTDTSTAPCSAGACSLRQLLAQVSAHPFPPDVIEVPPGTYTLNATLGALVVDHSVAILGAGADQTTISMPLPSNRATTGERVFDVAAPTNGLTPTVTISGVTVSGGTANSANGDFGGDIRNSGVLTLAADWITGGFACSGGGVTNVGGTLTIERSLVSANSAACGGGDSGGVDDYGTPAGGGDPDLPGHLLIEDSTIAGNDARLGAGVFSWNDATNTVLIRNSTIAANTNRTEPGGAVRGPGAGLNISAGIAVVENSILAGNVEELGAGRTPTNCVPGPGITTLGVNLDSGSDCGFTAAGGLSNTDPQLGPLQANGGPTATMALGAGSPALDRVPASGSGCPATDQRGVPRPQGSACDIGAFELAVASAPPGSGTAGNRPASTAKKVRKCKHGKVRRHGRCVKRHRKRHHHGKRHRHASRG